MLEKILEYKQFATWILGVGIAIAIWFFSSKWIKPSVEYQKEIETILTDPRYKVKGRFE